MSQHGQHGHTHGEIPASERWVQTYTGRRFYPLEPRPQDVDVVDIAHALGMICRYGGHSAQLYTVGQHSLLVASAVARDYPERLDWQLMALMHDASEAYLVDVPRPIKPFLVGYYEVEARVEACIQRALSLPTDPDGAALVKTYDSRILVDECRKLTGNSDWGRSFGEPLGVMISPLSPWQSERQFLAMYDGLMRGINAAKMTAK